jgi:hypothetical protein
MKLEGNWARIFIPDLSLAKELSAKVFILNWKE